MGLLQSLCSVPTAPFAEHRVTEFVRAFVRKRRGLRLREDSAGNLLVELKSKSRLPRWVFTAHMDHPGMIARKMRDRRTLEADFFGGVKVELVRGAKVRFFDGQDEIRGTVTEAMAPPSKDSRFTAPDRVTVRVARPVARGSIGMFDVGVGRYRGGKFHCRCCDDLAGAAACLEMIDRLRKKPPKSPAAVLLTRAEETGFIGCIAACRNGELLRRTDRVIAIETSAQQPYAPQGKGVIIRVGDRTSVFNSALTYFLGAEAQQLAKRDRHFRYQRALMPGGTCEATVYDVFGHATASLCIALGNYHNMDLQREKIAAEFVDVSDWQSMVKLFVRVAQRGHAFDERNSLLKEMLTKRFEKYAGLLWQKTRASGARG